MKNKKNICSISHQVSLLIIMVFSFNSFADYSNHDKSREVINELVDIHRFEESFVIEVLKNAKKRNEMLVSVANPAEKTKTWDEYKAIFLEKKRIATRNSNATYMCSRVKAELDADKKILRIEKLK